MTSPSVLVIGTFLSATGGRRCVCEDLAERLSAGKWAVLTASAYESRVARLLDMTATAWLRRKHYGVAQVDVYSGNAFIWAELVCWVLRRAGRQYVLTLHGGNLPPFAKAWPGRVRALLNSAAMVTTPSRYLAEQMKPYRNDLLLLPNALDIGNYEFRLREVASPKLVWLRTFHHIYNPPLAVQTLSGVSARFPAASLVMVGADKRDGSYQLTLETAEQLHISEKLTLPGGVARTEVPQWLNTGDIYLNTSNVDNAPVSVLEAMACGLCVVSTNAGGLPYLLEHEEDALLVPPNDPAAMTAAVTRILSEPGLSAKLSRNARIKAEQFDWASVMHLWDEVLHTAARSGK